MTAANISVVGWVVSKPVPPPCMANRGNLLQHWTLREVLDLVGQALARDACLKLGKSRYQVDGIEAEDMFSRAF